MKIIILTTKTEHHNYFINNLKIFKSELFLIYETKKKKKKFYKNQKLYKKSNKFEKIYFKNLCLLKNIKKKNFKDINLPSCIDYIKKINPHLIIVFGTGPIKYFFLKKIRSSKIVNLHGGNPEYYRGLDSIFWTIYHKDFKNLYTTLHFVKKTLDTGNIIEKIKIPLDKKKTLINLQAVNTENCIKLANKYINKIYFNRRLKICKQRFLGRYYSNIPDDLINICDENLKEYVRKKFK